MIEECRAEGSDMRGGCQAEYETKQNMNKFSGRFKYAEGDGVIKAE